MICPVCHIMYDEDNKYMFDHIRQCKGRKDIITTRWYKTKDLIKKESTVKNEITIDTTNLPVTR
jgi:hypothetical protein